MTTEVYSSFFTYAQAFASEHLYQIPSYQYKTHSVKKTIFQDQTIAYFENYTTLFKILLK